MPKIKSSCKPLLRQRGFTLIELMIVVVILGILAMIALPSYQESVRKAKRSDAQGALMNFAGAMERHFTTNGTYEGAASGGGDTGAPGIFATQVPTEGGTAYYNLRITAADSSSFTIAAQATGSMAGDGDYTLTNAGVRTWNGSSGW